MTGKSQDFVPIKDIRDGILYMDDGRIKVILSVSSLNLSLKSEEEQGAIVSQFQGFLNTLDFPVQIYVQSRRVDIKPYLDSLDVRAEMVEDDLMKNQIREYRQFVQTFAEKTNIMNKRFFVVIDYDKGGDGTDKIKAKNEQDENFELDTWRTQIEQRISVIAGGLSGVGLQVDLLTTEELIELFYKIYNPGMDTRSAK